MCVYELEGSMSEVTVWCLVC